MAKFAKLFDTQVGQILVTTGYDADDDSFLITIRSEDVSGIGVEMAIKGKFEAERNKEFEAFNQELAEENGAFLVGAGNNFAMRQVLGLELNPDIPAGEA